MGFHFLELQKFNKTEHELVNIIDKWAFMLKEANKLNEIPTALKKSDEIVEAFGLLEQGSWTAREIEAHHRFMEAVNSERDLRWAGYEDGRAEGKIEGKAEVAKQMLSKGLAVAMIAELTGLSVEQVESLKKGL